MAPAWSLWSLARVCVLWQETALSLRVGPASEQDPSRRALLTPSVTRVALQGSGGCGQVRSGGGNNHHRLFPAVSQAFSSWLFCRSPSTSGRPQAPSLLCLWSSQRCLFWLCVQVWDLWAGFRSQVCWAAAPRRGGYLAEGPKAGDSFSSLV